MRRLLFLIRSLDVGGAERQLVELVKGLDRQRFVVAVATLYGGGRFEQELTQRDDVALHSLGKRGRWDVQFVRPLQQVVRTFAPTIMIGYLPTINELALVTGRLRGVPVVWNIRASFMDLQQYDWLPRGAFRVGAWLSSYPDLTIFNSWAGLRYHESCGYRARRATVIPNGIDADRYRIDRSTGARVRQEWGVGPETRLIGLVGRIDPIKGHPLFLEAAARVRTEARGCRFVCIGSGDARLQQRLEDRARALGLTDVLTWAGGRADMPAVYNALDLCVSASIGEGFPNVIGEAMASGIPCVVTDVGDSARIVGDTGVVVPPADPERLARGMLAALEDRDRGSAEHVRERAERVRERIVAEFSIRRMVDTTQDALEQLT